MDVFDSVIVDLTTEVGGQGLTFINVSRVLGGAKAGGVLCANPTNSDRCMMTVGNISTAFIVQPGKTHTNKD